MGFHFRQVWDRFADKSLVAGISGQVMPKKGEDDLDEAGAIHAEYALSTPEVGCV
jgi:hypothetical protein